MSCNFFNRHKWEPIFIVEDSTFLGERMSRKIKVAKCCTKCNEIIPEYDYSPERKCAVHYMFREWTDSKAVILLKKLERDSHGNLIIPKVHLYKIPPNIEEDEISPTPPVHQPPRKIKWGL